LQDGSYQQAALDRQAADLSQPVTVYRFTDSVQPVQTEESDPYAPTLACSFTIDTAKTNLLTYGFDGGNFDDETGVVTRDYFLPSAGSIRLEQPRLLIVLGEDIKDYTLQGYRTGDTSAGNELDGVSATVTRTRVTLGEALNEVCTAYLQYNASVQWGIQTSLSLEACENALTEALYGQSDDAFLSSAFYGDGGLEELLCNVVAYRRVMYLTEEITVPAGDSVTVELKQRKTSSYNHCHSSRPETGMEGYDLLTKTGSCLTFTEQTATLVGMDGLTVGYDSFGFDPDADASTVTLDLDVPHYALEVKKRLE
jgi:hypothetical protein